MNAYLSITLALFVTVGLALLIGLFVPQPWAGIVSFVSGSLIGFFWIGPVIIKKWF